MRTTLAIGCRTRRQDAFTLIEVSIVVFILAIIMAASMPYLVRTYNNALLNDVVRSFSTTCQFARIKAVTQQRPVVMHMDLKRQMFWITQEPGPPVEGAEFNADDTGTLKVYELPKRVAMVAAELMEGAPVPTTENERRGSTSTLEQGIEFTFYPNGTCDGAKVLFRGAEPKDFLSVVVDPVTTRANVYTVKP
jgi:prepilin-type N-terminal cleavage/methylation domain-containing protein